MENKDFRGFSLFTDIADKELRIRNRAVIMANILEMNTKNRKISIKGAELLAGYFNSLPKNERKDTYDKFEEVIKERGYATKPN